MNVSMKIKFIAGVVAILVLLFTAGFISLEQLNKQDEAREWVVHTLKVINQLHFIRATVKDAEIAEQGYILTGSKEYLTLFSDSAPKIAQLITALRDLTQDNPKQQLQVSLLSTKVNGKLAQLKETIDLARSNKRQEALADINSGRGQNLLLDVRRIASEMINTENQLLEERTKTLWAECNRTTTILVGSIIIAGILLLFLSGLLWRFLKARQKTLIQLEKSEKELRDREATTRTLVETAPDGIITFDSKGIIESVNQAGSSMFHCQSNEMIGQNLSQFIPGYLTEKTKHTELDDVITWENRIFGMVKEMVGITKDGTNKPIELAWSVLHLHNRSVFTAVVRDISERKAVENRLALQYAVGRILSETQTLQDMVNRVLATIGEHMQWSVGAVWFVDEAHNLLKCFALWSLAGFINTKFLLESKNLTFAPGVGLRGRVWKSGQPCCIEDLSKDDNFQRQDLALDAGLKSALAFPIFIGNEVFGVFEFFTDKIRSIDEPMRETMAAIGDIIGQFIQRKQTEEAQNLADTRFQAIFNQTYEFIGLLSPEGTLLEANQTALDFQGVQRSDVIGKPFWLTPWWTYSEEVQSKIKEAIKTVCQERKLVQFETYHLGINDTKIFVDFSLKPVIGEDGSIIMLIPEGHDITKRKKAEEELRLSQERYDLAVEGSHDGIWDWDLANNKIFYSDLAYTQLGYTPGELDITNRERLFSLIHPHDLLRVQTALVDHLERRKPYDIEYRLRTKSGDYKWIHSRGQAVWNDGGIATRFAGSHRDITERVQAQEKLALSEGRFRQMAENIKEIFWITDARGATPVYVSPAYEHIFGRTVDSLMAQPHQFFEATYPEDRNKLANAIRCQREVTHSSEIDYRITQPSGEIRWLWARLSTIVDANNNVVGLCGVTHDVTDRKEAELRVSEFYSAVSHELRTPLTSIRGSLGLIEGGLAGEVSAPAMQMIKIGRAESDRLIRLINDILDIKKVEAGQMELHKEQIEPQKLVTKTLDAIAGMAAEAQITLNNYVGTRDKIYGDTERLMQVLTNLVSNAIKFSPCNREVSVSVEHMPSQMLRFAVRDQGPGIPADKMHKLFGKFQQIDSLDTRKREAQDLAWQFQKLSLNNMVEPLV